MYGWLVAYIHIQDKTVHKLWDEVQRDNTERFKHVEAIFLGAQKRRLLANRLLFSVDLAPMDERVKSAIHAPFRPHILDPEDKWGKIQLKGMLVEGFDPKSGIRAGYRRYGMMDQFRAPGKRRDQTQFQDILPQLIHCR